MITSGYVKTKRSNVFQQETGKLFIFDGNSVSVLRGWPVMRAWKKTCVKHPNWMHEDPQWETTQAIAKSLLSGEISADKIPEKIGLIG